MLLHPGVIHPQPPTDCAQGWRVAHGANVLHDLVEHLALALRQWLDGHFLVHALDQTP
jgi:hypothetical protein